MIHEDVLLLIAAIKDTGLAICIAVIGCMVILALTRGGDGAAR